MPRASIRLIAHRRGSVLTPVAVLAGVLSALSIGAVALANDGSSKPAEESRFSAAAFRAGLKKRGLTDLLDLYLKEFPPTSKTATLLMRRELRLAEFGDPSRPPNERREAVAEANNLLAEVIAENRDDRRRFDWQFTLAHSLLYDEAEPFFTSLLYRGGSREDHLRLRELTARALAVLESLATDLAVEYERIDNLSIRKFERLEREGYIEQLDLLAPRADYLRLWALYYDSLPRDDADPARASQLNQIRETFRNEPGMIDTPHAISRVQVQGLLLLGMTCRLLNDHPAAREHLDRALEVANRMDDPAERDRIGWAATLAGIERVRNERDDGRFETALKSITRFRRSISGLGRDDFGLRVVAALLERSVYQAWAASSQRNGWTRDAEQYRASAWKVLQDLVDRHPDRRDEVYATVCHLIGTEANPDELDPFEQCALVSGLLFEAGRDKEGSDRRLDRAIRVGERFVTDTPDGAESLVPEVLYNVAVAMYRRGRATEATARFLAVAREHEDFVGSLDAATFAVQLASALYEDDTQRDRPEIQSLYRDALETLMRGYANTEASRYWRFYYAQLLHDLGRYDAAATQFALVDSEHQHYLESIFFRLRSTALVLEEHGATDRGDDAGDRKRTDEFFTLQRDFLTRASRALEDNDDPARASLLRSMAGRAKLLGAEVRMLPQVDLPAEALEVLSGFEAAYPDLSGLSGRVWRVRLMAYEKLGRLNEAARAIPAYIAADPENAGPALQSLYVSLTDDVEQARQAGDSRQAQRKADLALLLARQIFEWAGRAGDESPPIDRSRLLVQLAEANLLAGQYERARELFTQCKAGGEHAPSAVADEVSVRFGRAEALFQLALFAEALPEFNRLALELPEADPIRWKSLLRDLECRTALEHPAGDIIKVIEQQRYLYPKLGGPGFAAEFEKLLRENQRRPDRE